MGTILNMQHLALSQAKHPVQPSQARISHSARQPLFLRRNFTSSAGMRSRVMVVHATARAATLYDILDLAPDVGLSDIKRAYRQMARKYHPDVCPSNRAEESTRRFIEIQEAYETLSDPRRRAVYDHAVAMGRGSAANGRMPWSPYAQDCQTADWKSQWESQLFEFKRQSSNRERRTNSWAAQMRRQNGLHDA
eukprot:c18741_g1_i1 orf=250-828(+)